MEGHRYEPPVNLGVLHIRYLLISVLVSLVTLDHGVVENCSRAAANATRFLLSTLLLDISMWACFDHPGRFISTGIQKLSPRVQVPNNHILTPRLVL